MTDPYAMGLAELRDALRARELSAAEALDATLRRADAIEPLNPFMCRLDEAAAEAAADSDARIARGAPRALEGVPVTIKDVLWLAGTPSPDGSLARKGFVPRHTSPAVRDLLDAGCVVVAKTTNPEFCWNGTCASAIHGTTTNPWDPERTTGGSSGGAAAATAGGVGAIGLGTDAGGSVRQPAALCGIVGFKPTTGLVAEIPRATAYWSLSTTGVLARSVRDAAIVAETILRRDFVDRLSIAIERPAADAPPTTLRGRRLLVCEDFDGEFDVDDGVRSVFRGAVDRLAAAGAEIVRAPLQMTSGLDLWYRIGRAELAAYCEDWGDDRSVMADDIQTALAEADEADPLDYARGQRERNEHARRFHARLAALEVDAVLTPTVEVEAWSARLPFPDVVNGTAMSEDVTAHHLMAGSLAGCPGLTIPCGLGAAGLPVGLQLLGPRMSDWQLLRLGEAVEQVLAPVPRHRFG